MERLRKYGSTRTRSGGDTHTNAYCKRRAKVRDFIGRLPASESHYGCGKSKRIYVDSRLTISKLWRLYNNAHSVEKVSLAFFHKIFKQDFNIGFSCPRVDVCTTCECLGNKLKKCVSETEKENLQGELLIHKTRAKAFYKLLKMRPANTVTIAFDLQSVHNLPRLPIQETYYARQLALYNLGICCLDNSLNYSYTWLESQAGRGSNEIASALIDCICKLESKGAIQQDTCLRLFCDGCGGQNKNNILISSLAWSLKFKFAKIKKIGLFFPVRGHSFLPCDRLFGRINRDLNRFESVVAPVEFHQIFRKHCHAVNVLGVHWKTYDWKSLTTSLFRTIPKLQKMKRIEITKSAQLNMKLFQYYFCGTNIDFNSSKSEIENETQPTELFPRRNISKEKLSDIHNLLQKAFGENWKIDPLLETYTSLTSEDLTNAPIDCDCMAMDIDVQI